MDLHRQHQKALSRGTELARATGASLEIVAFVHEFLEALPNKPGVRERMVALPDCGGLNIRTLTVWDKHVHVWPIDRCQNQPVDAVLKTDLLAMKPAEAKN